MDWDLKSNDGSTASTGSRKGADMSKGMDQKKNTKKKPAKTLMEKRAAKAEKKKKQ